ncbi:MAG TPA: efflux RND transporter periplasmic adaptor subunit [Longimicrobiales bacterium]|nr:efflux RND transporter periplasmic adaptor subunit [Longimicrobiales bacterium]
MSALKRYNGAAALMAVVVAAGCSGGEAQESATSGGVGAEPVRRIINVQTVQLEPREFTEFITLTGTLEASSDVQVSAEESGVVRELYVDKGARVRVGQPVARIDDQVLRAQYDQARSEAALAKETYERQRRLWEEEKIGTEIAYLRAKYGAETAAANARMLAARLERTIVRAPIAGVLDDRLVEVGAMVAPGTPIARIVDADPVEVTAGVPERYAAEIRPGAAVRVTIDHLGGSTFSGAAGYVGTALDARTRTFPVEFTVANASGVLKPGMVARLEVQRRTVEEALLVPREAVQRVSTGYMVFVVTGEGDRTFAEARPVQLGADAGSQVAIASGVSAGEQVIVVGQQQVANGDAVRVVAEEEQ